MWIKVLLKVYPFGVTHPSVLVPKGFTNVGSIAASALKVIYLTRLQRFKSNIFKVETVFQTVRDLKSDSNFTKRRRLSSDLASPVLNRAVL